MITGNIPETMIKIGVPQVLQVILNDLERRGDGKSLLNPVRRVKQVFTLDGTLLVENDPYRCFTAADLVHFVEQEMKLRTIEVDKESVIRNAVAYRENRINR